MNVDLTDPIFNDDNAARAHFEAIHWPNGRICPHRGSVGNSVQLKGKSTRAGSYKCRDCEKVLTVTIGTICERGHIPLRKWLSASRPICISKNGISVHQLFGTLGFGSHQTA
jgi:transposase-like protein